MRKKLLAVLSIPTLSLGFLIAAAEPAHASPFITICNYYLSDDRIMAYNDDIRTEWLIQIDQCRTVDNKNGHARVDVDPAGGYADIDSYKKKENSGSWGGCTVSENGASNPYNGSTTTYWTSEYTNCF